MLEIKYFDNLENYCFEKYDLFQPISDAIDDIILI